MQLRICCALATLWVWFAHASVATAGLFVHFDSPPYQVQPGGTVQAQILYDADPNTPGDQPIPGGLFREALLSTNGFNIFAGFNDVTPPAEMNTPLVPNGEIYSGTNSQFSIKAQESPSAVSGYLGTVLLTVNFRNSGTPGSYPITLSLNNLASPNFEDFATRSSQDAGIAFGNTTITVVPEPVTFWPLLLLTLALLRKRPTVPITA